MEVLNGAEELSHDCSDECLTERLLYTRTDWVCPLLPHELFKASAAGVLRDEVGLVDNRVFVESYELNNCAVAQLLQNVRLVEGGPMHAYVESVTHFDNEILLSAARQLYHLLEFRRCEVGGFPN